MNGSWKLAVLACGLVAGSAWAQAVLPDNDVQVANEGRIGDRWMLAPGATLATPAYPAHLAVRGDDVCLALGYQINPDGSTSNFAVIKQWSSAGDAEPVDGYWAGFAQAGADALSQWRFQARPGISPVQPTYTVATLAFNAGEDAPAALRANCAVADLAATIQSLKSSGYEKSVERRELERLNRAARANRTMVNPLGGSTR